jgi:hypothetical protein
MASHVKIPIARGMANFLGKGRRTRKLMSANCNMDPLVAGWTNWIALRISTSRAQLLNDGWLELIVEKMRKCEALQIARSSDTLVIATKVEYASSGETIRISTRARPVPLHEQPQDFASAKYLTTVLLFPLLQMAGSRRRRDPKN